MIRYKLLDSKDSDHLSQLVEELLSDGWKIVGAPFGFSVLISEDTGSNLVKRYQKCFCQALIKEEGQEKILPMTKGEFLLEYVLKRHKEDKLSDVYEVVRNGGKIWKAITEMS